MNAFDWAIDRHITGHETAESPTYEQLSEILDEANERIAALEAQLAAAERDVWNAAIDCVAKVIENVPYADEKTVEIAKQSAQVARTFKK